MHLSDKELREDNYPECYQQVCESLVCEIRDSKRWSAIKESWEALLHVQLMARQMKEEADSFERLKEVAAKKEAPDGNKH